MILSKEELINLVKSMDYEDGFYVTVEEVEYFRGKDYFLRIVTEENSEPLIYKGLLNRLGK